MDFNWNPDYDNVLKQIAESDTFDVKWDLLKNIIKHKLEQNISLFLGSTTPPSPAPSFDPVQLQSGGLKLPPFPPRQQSSIMIEAPVNYMNEEQAKVLRENIFIQLDMFDSDPPFTIQRICELCVEPKKHYKSIGKYLRAVEKSTLVTSTWAEFPPLTEQEKDVNVRNIMSTGSELLSIPSTPLFSPIPFLHNDARSRSRSQSPPPSPLALSALGPVSGGHPETLNLEPQALGLVDELDDPRPGHMSDHPTALSAVTTIDDGKDGTPIVQSLESRFIKEEDENGMAVDENKENEST
jgi:serine/threonine-protein phosphatase 4 regulatory subunit 2